MAYQHSKDRTQTGKELGEENPFAVLLAKLNGTSLSRPRKPNAFDLWATENQDVFTPVLHAAVTQEQPNRYQLAGLQSKVKKAEFDKLSPEIKAEWQARVEERHRKELVEWKARWTSEPSTAPEDRQRYVNRSLVSCNSCD